MVKQLPQKVENKSLVSSPDPQEGLDTRLVKALFQFPVNMVQILLIKSTYESNVNNAQLVKS